MVYIPNIPAGNNIPALSQGQIQENFGQLNTQFSYDHFAFNAGANNGKHKQTTLVQEASPSNITVANEIDLYCNSSNQLTMSRPSDGTKISISNSIDPLSADNGYSWLPGNMMIQWGKTVNFNSSPRTKTTTFTQAFSGNPYSLVLTVHNVGLGDEDFPLYKVLSVTSTTFDVRVSIVKDFDMYYVAIGPRT